MNTYIALLRAINVGGNNLIKMADLKLILAGIGLENVRTYIQSGNVAFECAEADKTTLGTKMSAAIETSHGFAPPVFILEKAEIVAALDAFDLAYEEEKYVYFNFLERPATDAKLSEADDLLLTGDAYKLTDKVLYLHCAAGIGRSKLAVKLNRLLGVEATARNLRSVKKIIELAG